MADDRLVTIATFDNVSQAQLAKNVLETEGIAAVLADEMTVTLFWHLSNAVGGVKVQVLEKDADQAVAILEKELGPADDGEVGEEELAAQAEAAGREDEANGTESEPRPAPEAPVSPPVVAAPPPDWDAEPPPSERDEYARRLFFMAWVGLVLPPLWFFALYFFLNAAFGTGPLSPKGRYNLLVGGIVTGVGSMWVLVFFWFLRGFW